MVERILTDKIRELILYGLIALFAFFAGQSIFNIMGERTLGSIVRHGIAPLAIVGLIIAVRNEHLIASIFDFRGIRSFSWPRLLVGVILGIVLGVIMVNYSGFGMIYGGIIIFILATLGFSIFYIFTGEPFNAPCLFWCAYPLIYFLQAEVKKLGFEKPMFDNLAIPFSAAYVLILFISVILANTQNQGHLEKTPVRFIYWLILLSIPSIFFSNNPMKSFIFFFFDMIIPIMFFILLMIAIKDKAQIEWFVKVMMFSLATLIFLTFYFYRPGEEDASVINLYSAKTVIPSGYIAYLAAMILPFSVMFYKVKRSKIYFFFSLAFFAIIVCSNYRSVILGLFAASSLFFLVSKIYNIKKIWYLLICFTISLVTWFALWQFNLAPNIRHRFTATIQQMRDGASFDELSSGRGEIWNSAVRMLKEHPVIGIGAGMWQDNAYLYKSRLYQNFNPGYGYSSYYSVDAHNVFLNMYLKYGIFPLIVFIFFIFYVIKKIFLLYRREIKPQEMPLAASFFISIATWLIMSNFDFRFYDHNVGFLLLGYFFWTLIGLSLKYAEINKSERLVP